MAVVRQPDETYEEDGIWRCVAFVDMVSYSRHVANDERGTLERWHTLQSELLAGLVSKYSGQIIKISGDEILVEFRSSEQAAKCFYEFQLENSYRNRHLPVSRRMEFRVGVNSGKIVRDESDLYGHAVNVAARLTALADPSGIVISHSTLQEFDVPDDQEFEDLGQVDLKNIGAPVRAFRWRAPGALTSIPESGLERKTPVRPSIAVLPFRNQTGNSEDDYFCDGITEDIIMSLSGLRELFVISRGSTLRYHGLNVDVSQVGRALGVRYILTGSIRKSDKRIRVSMELTDSGNNRLLWGDRVDAELGDLFDIQDNAVTKVVSGLAPMVREAELNRALRKRPENFTAYDLTLKSLDLILRLNKETAPLALDFLKQASDIDPTFAMPVAWMARWHNLSIGQGWTNDIEQSTSEALRLAAHAFDLDPQNALALATYGHLMSYLKHDYDSALDYLGRATDACPSHSLAWVLSSATLTYTGRTREAIEHAERGIHLSPFDRGLFYYYSFLCMAHYANGTHSDAIKWGRLALNEQSGYTAAYRYLAAAYAAAGRKAEAREVIQSLLKLQPNFCLKEQARNVPFENEEFCQWYLSHLSEAGLS